MKHHRMQLPREVIIGNKTIELVGEISKKLGFSDSALIVTGPKTFDLAGKKVKELLEEEKMQVYTFLAESATIKGVEALDEQIIALKPQLVFAVGGGTSIDVAKCGSAQSKVPFISIPTTASHDGIASPLSSIKGSEKPYSVMAQAPLAIIADTDIIMNAPWRLTISGCADVVAKITAVRDWKLAHEESNEYFGGYAASLALMSAKHVTQFASLIAERSEEGVRVLLEALISCGVSMSIAGSSRPCSGSEHLFSHALAMINNNQALHGEKCGVGTILMAYLQGTRWKQIREKLRQLGAPVTACDLGASKEDIIAALELASTIRPERYTVLTKQNMNRDTCERIAKATAVI
jgi:glycerol-1-phosphate dehydrogenase [NAD(P)+]